MIIGRGNRSTRRKSTPVPLVHRKSHTLSPDEKPARRGGKTATSRLSYGMTIIYGLMHKEIYVHKIYDPCSVMAVNSREVV
jgi:hypothetical protein